MRSLRPLLTLLCLTASGCASHGDGSSGRWVSARGLDAVTAPGAPVRVRAKFERAGVDLVRERVTFEVEGRRIADLTDLDGVGQATVTLAKAGTYEFRAWLPERDHSRARAQLFVVSRPVVVVDIDGTISAAGIVGAIARGDRADTFPGAPELLRDLAQRYQVVYLTARDDVMDRKTRAFLRLHAFPTGPVLFNDWGLRTSEEREQLRPSQHGKFKLKALQQLKSRGLTLAFGIGDKDTDSEAYRGVGIPAFIRREEPPKGTEGVEYLGTYALLRERLKAQKRLD